MKITKATRWRVFAGVWIQSLFTSATAYFSLFCIPLTTKFGWSDSDFALAYTIYMFTYCAVGFLGGSLAQKLSPRITIYLGLALFAGGWFLTGFASSIPQLYIFYGLLAGAGGGLIYPACLPTALKWFPDRSGSISGLVQAGASCGPFIMSPIAQRQIGQSAMTAALCVSIMTLANMCGRIGFGFIYDKLKGWNSLLLLMVINGASMLMLTQAKSLPFFILCVVLVGFSFGGLLVVFAPMVRMIFGSKYYNSNYGLIFIGYGIGAFIGPKISASFYDSTGVYTYGFVGSACLAVAAIVLILVAKKMYAKMSA